MNFYGQTEKTNKADRSPVTKADLASNRVILAELATEFPDDAVRSEEALDRGTVQTADRTWIVDPLDGTKEFLSQNGEFSVMIGLVRAGKPVLGVVYLPALDRMFSAVEGEGCYREDAQGRELLEAPQADSDNIRLVGSRSHPDALVQQLCVELNIEDMSPCGSVGVKCSRIAEGRRDLYVHPVPYLKEWDTCAPEVILREAGGWVSDCVGDPLEYNKENPGQPQGILACAPGIREIVLDKLEPLWQNAVSDS